MQAHFIIYRLDAPSSTQHVADVIDILRATPLEVHPGPLGTIVQGKLEEVMAAICQCHRLLSHENRVLTSIVLEDDPALSDTPAMSDTMHTSFHKESQPCKASC